MTAAQLIEILSRVPPDAEVETEGCDCTGDTAGIYVMDVGRGKKSAMICRSEGSNVDYISRDGVLLPSKKPTLAAIPDVPAVTRQPGDLYVGVRVFRMFGDPAENDDVVRFVGPLRNQPGWEAQLGDPIRGPGGEKYFSVKIVTG
jgi:hypothetical protein